MRVSLVALCGLTAYAVHDGARSARAQLLPEPDPAGDETATRLTADGVLEEVSSLVPPEQSSQPLFSTASVSQAEASINLAMNADAIDEAEAIEIEVIQPSPVAITSCELELQSIIDVGHAVATSISSEFSAPAFDNKVRETEQNLSLDFCGDAVADEVEDSASDEVAYRVNRRETEELALENAEEDNRGGDDYINPGERGEVDLERAIGDESVAFIAQNLSNAQTLSTPQPFIESSSGRIVADGRVGDDILDAAESVANQLGTGELDASPLERPPTRLFNLETANHLREGQLQLSAGFHQTPPDNYPATGNQIYHGEITWGIRDDLQIALTGQVFDDPPGEAIDGEFPNVTLLSVASSAKYRILENEDFSLGILGSIELLSLESSLFDTDDSDQRVIGSLQFPFTYNASPEVQLHLTPGVNFLPGSFSGEDFYGTTFNLGTGISWQPSERWMLFSTLTIPIGPGDNSIDSDDGSFDRRLVWSVGTRYNVTPKVGVDLYATNGFGVTPATSALTFIPDGDDALIGVRLHYTPDARSTYRQTFRSTPRVPLSERDRQLLIDGFTLTTANTLQPGSVALSGGVGSNGNYSFGVAYSPDQDFQIEAIIEEFGSDDEVGVEFSAGNNLKYMLGGRVRLLDQVQGDPVSLAARLLGGRDTGETNQIGFLFLDVPLTYQLNSRTALSFNPRMSAFADEFQFGVGLGINYEVLDGLQLIGEVTPLVNGEPTVWAAGARYRIPETSVSLDLYATNAIGRHGIGTLAGDLGGARLGFNVNWILGDR